MSLNFLSRILNFKAKKCFFVLASSPKVTIVPSASMTSKEYMDPSIKKPKPYPYNDKKYTFFHQYWDSTLQRFDENTKIILVDGNIAAGKTAFAKQLADAFDMKYVPEPNLECLYLSPYGHDLRLLNPIVPPSFKICDLETFYKNPFHQNVTRMQLDMYVLRIEAYVDALVHLLNTGQGIVMERSAYSDFVFWQAMHNAGYLSKRVMDYYADILKNTLDDLMYPHLVIYLDITPEVALQRIKERNNPIEVNSPVLTKQYLTDIDYCYKQQFLQNMEPHCELLIYDWSNYGDVEVVVEDIEKIDFDRYTKYDKKLQNWCLHDDWEFGVKRRFYTNDGNDLVQQCYIFRPTVTEIFRPNEEAVEYDDLMQTIPGGKYLEGYNVEMGDKIWFKHRQGGHRYKHFHYWSL